jgi:hypothetical protein
MVDIVLMTAGDDRAAVLLGDVGQQPPVGPGQALACRHHRQPSVAGRSVDRSVPPSRPEPDRAKCASDQRRSEDQAGEEGWRP